MATQPMPAPAIDLAPQLAHLQAENQQLHQQNRQVAQIAVDEPDATQLAIRRADRVALLLESERALVGFAVNEEVTVKCIVDQGQRHPIDLRFVAGAGSIGWVLQRNEPFIANSANHPQLTIPFPQQWPCRNLLTVPINKPADVVLGQPDFTANGENRWKAVIHDTLLGGTHLDLSPSRKLSASWKGVHEQRRTF